MSTLSAVRVISLETQISGPLNIVAAIEYMEIDHAQAHRFNGCCNEGMISNVDKMRPKQNTSSASSCAHNYDNVNFLEDTSLLTPSNVIIYLSYICNGAL